MAEADFTLNFVCPTCNARPQKECMLSTGTPRLSSHVERQVIATGYQHSPALCEGSLLAASMDWPRNWMAKSAPPAGAGEQGE